MTTNPVELIIELMLKGNSGNLLRAKRNHTL